MPTTHEPDAPTAAKMTPQASTYGAGRTATQPAPGVAGDDASRPGTARGRTAPPGPSRAVHDMMIRLPAGMLRQCGERFPYILERVAADWADPARLQATIDALIYDARGGRGGFPFEVLAELAELRRCHERWVGPRTRSGR